MIPKELADLASVIDPNWATYEHPDDRNEVLRCAQRILDAGYRKDSQ